MADHEQTDTVPDDRDSAPATDETTDAETTDESDPLESTTVEETPEQQRETKGTESELDTFAGRNAVRSIGLVAGLGTLIFWMPVLFTSFSVSMWVQFGLGLGIAVVASVAALKKGQDAVSAMGLPLLAGILGLLVAAMPFLMEVGSTESGPLETGNMVVGVLVVVFSIAAILGFRKEESARSSTRSTA